MKTVNFATAFTFLFVSIAFVSADAQIPAGGPYTVERSVIANGGNTASNGSRTIAGTTAESAAGANSAAGIYAVRGGFWQPAPFAPTAAEATICGRVVGSNGRPVSRAMVTLTNVGGVTRHAQTNKFGYYQLFEVPVGDTYTIEAAYKSYRFVPQIITVMDNLTDVNFVALE